MNMREEFEQIAKELEDKDVWFRDVLSRKTTIDTSLETWSVSRDVAEFLYNTVMEKKPERIVEVGMSQGYSTIWLAEAAKNYGGKVDTIEIEPSKIIAARERFSRLGYDDTVTIHVGNALDVLAGWKDSVDLLFLDAVKREYIAYVKTVEHLFVPGTCIIADDVTEWRRKLDEFFDYIEANSNYISEVLPLGHGVCMITKRMA